MEIVKIVKKSGTVNSKLLKKFFFSYILDAESVHKPLFEKIL